MVSADRRTGGRREPGAIRRLLLLTTLLAGCALSTGPGEEPLDVSAALAGAQAGDLRAQFGGIVCPRIEATGRDCADVLRWQLPPVDVPEASPSASRAARYRLVFVSGLFTECLERWVRPFEDSVDAFSAAGFDARAIPVAGRGSAAENAVRIASAMDRLPRDGRQVVVFAYSKGVVDVLEALISHNDAMRDVAAVVAIAGAQHGSFLAETRAGIYEHLVQALPMARCAAGSGAEVSELRHDVRRAWWDRHQASIRVPIFSLVGAPDMRHVTPALRGAHRELGRIAAQNDGNILWSDAIARGGRLLGLVNADHWTIAVPLAQNLPVLAPLIRDDVPRSILLDGALGIVDAYLAGWLGDR